MFNRIFKEDMLTLRFRYHFMMENYYYKKALKRGFDDDDRYTVKWLDHMTHSFATLSKISSLYRRDLA